MQPVLESHARPALTPAQPSVWLLRQDTCKALRSAAHQLLDAVVMDYADAGAARVKVVHAQTTAPDIRAKWRGLPLTASLSYAGDLALIALCPAARVGVDLVRVETLPDCLDVARLYLGPALSAALAQRHVAERTSGFAQAWAEMEARSKCTGQGLTEWSPARAQQLAAAAVRPLAVPAGYVAAQAVWAGGVLDFATSPSTLNPAQESLFHAAHQN